MFAFLDTPFDPDHSVYTRANAGEIIPDPIPPLGWSVLGPGIEEGFRVAFCDSFGLIPRPGPERPYQMVGRFAARFHLNLSVIRTTAQRLPGTSADVVDVQYFGDAAAHGLPGHADHPDDRRFRLKSPPVMGRTVAGLGRRVDRDRATVDAISLEVLAAVGDAGTSDVELVRLLRRTATLFGQVLGTHVTCRGLTSPILEQAVGALTRAGVPEDESLRHVSTIPDLESAKPSRALAELARSIPHAGPLAALVAAGSAEDLATSQERGAAELHASLTAFLEDYGHRGVGEFDPTRPTWEQRPDDVLRLLDRQRSGSGSDAEEVADPAELHEIGRLARPIVAAARSAMSRAERTKDTSMRTTNQMRRLLFALRDRWSDRIGPDHFLLLTLDEVEAVAHGGALPAEAELDRRSEDLVAASAVIPAEWSDGSLRLVSGGDGASGDAEGDGSGQGDPGSALVGIPGSPGRATGRVRVMRDPYGDFESGDVLVAHMTDTAWTPLFLSAAAVVTDVGGVLSHATIVARDLGVPAVVNTKVGTTRLVDGALVEVDGTAGTVTIQAG